MSLVISEYPLVDEEDIDYWFAKSAATGDCIEALAAPKNEYPRVAYAGKLYQLHRLVARYYLGKANGRLVNHLCENKRCVNPEHLEYTSNSGNMMHNKGPSFKCGHPRENNTYANECRICRNERSARYNASRS